ncbi:TPA: helix-turn-helix domain-containing protein [Stenotrophomonas maltophilia]
MNFDDPTLWHAKITASQKETGVEVPGGAESNLSTHSTDQLPRTLPRAEAPSGGQKKRNPAGGPGFARGYSFSEKSNDNSITTYPATGSARAKVLHALMLGRNLTSADAWREFGSSRLAADVHELRRMGWPILSTWISVTTRHQTMARVVQYHLPLAQGVS